MSRVQIKSLKLDLRFEDLRGIMTNTFDANLVLDSLASSRKVFHSEFDFQFAYAWTAKNMYPYLEVRLETHPTPSESLDLALFDPSKDSGVAIEFKYKTLAWEGDHQGEIFALKSHGASDIGCYDIVKDIARVERFIAEKPRWNGYAITLTNDPTYWNLRTHGKQTNAEEFRVSDGLTLKGSRRWGPNTELGTKKGREADLVLAGTYKLMWRPYSEFSPTVGGSFKSLLVQVHPKKHF